MKRKTNDIDDEETKLSKILFNKPDEFVSKISTSACDTELEELKPAWIDEDDDIFIASKVINTMNTDLYSNTLKQKYTNLMGTPNWAKLRVPSEKSYAEDDQLMRAVGHLQRKNIENLPTNILSFKKFPTASTGTEGPTIDCIEFHPKSSVALVGGSSGVVSLFSIGRDINMLHQFNLHNFKILCTYFSMNGSKAYISSSNKNEFCVYDLIKAESEIVRFPKNVRKSHIFVLSPNSKFIVISNNYDEMFILCAFSFEVIHTIKLNYKIKSVTFTSDDKLLYCFDDGGIISIWDLSTFRVISKFQDDGCVNASCIALSPCNEILATGSGEGIVNIYECSKLSTNSKPVKVVSHLKTCISKLRFNCSSEILAASSSFYPNSVKLVHLPSYTVFSNFPGNVDLSHVAALSFSPNSGYMAIGNNKKTAHLFRLNYFKNY